VEALVAGTVVCGAVEVRPVSAGVGLIAAEAWLRGRRSIASAALLSFNLVAQLITF